MLVKFYNIFLLYSHYSKLEEKMLLYAFIDKNEILLNNSKTSHIVSYYTLYSFLDKKTYNLMMA